jgi:hypothetical protein
VTDEQRTEEDYEHGGSDMGTGFLTGELDAVETKLRKRLVAAQSYPDTSVESDRNRQMIDYHSLQTRLIWGLMKATASELQSVFQRHSPGHGSPRAGKSPNDVQQGTRAHSEEEHEILAELSRRWAMWCREQDNLFA